MRQLLSDQRQFAWLERYINKWYTRQEAAFPSRFSTLFVLLSHRWRFFFLLVYNVSLCGVYVPRWYISPGRPRISSFLSLSQFSPAPVIFWEGKRAGELATSHLRVPFRFFDTYLSFVRLFYLSCRVRRVCSAAYTLMSRFSLVFCFRMRYNVQVCVTWRHRGENSFGHWLPFLRALVNRSRPLEIHVWRARRVASRRVLSRVLLWGAKLSNGIRNNNRG